jgi:hypothetical protein
MNRKPHKKLVLEPKARGGGWKLTEVEIEFPSGKPAKLRSIGTETTIILFDDIKPFVDKFFKMQYKQYKAFGE